MSLLFSHAQLWRRGLQHARLPCPSPSPRACSNSCPLNCWCHPAILSFVVPFSSCLRSFPTSGFFQMNQLFAWGGQSIGVSASTTVLPMNIQGWSPLGWTGLTSLLSKGLLRLFSSTTTWKHQFFGAQPSVWFNWNIHTWLLERWYVPQSSPTLCNPMDYSQPGSSVHGIFQARILEWVAISYSRGSSQPRDQSHISSVSCIDRQILYHWKNP